ncbi:MAG: hypothetical protein HY554_03630, partial [Elusimicrobia bacterium]|nr:hypothetical protein [Elusimicrobiota bacterium]
LVEGTAADLSGVQGVEVAAQDAGTGLYWTAGSFTSVAPVFEAAADTAAWRYPAAQPWADGASYRLVARGLDGLGNYSTVYATAAFTFDASTPSAAATFPVPDSTIESLASIVGTASDPGAAPSGIGTVELYLRRATDGAWWDWTAESWTPALSSTTAGASAAWSKPASAALQANLAHATSYYLALRARDRAVPVHTFDGLASGTTFTFQDVTPPSAVTDLAASSTTASGRLELRWTAPGDDGSQGAIANGRYRIQYSTEPAASFSTSAAQVALTTSAAAGSARHYALTNLLAGATYFLRVWSADDADNWSAASNAAEMNAGPTLARRIVGHVTKASSEGITAVQIDGFDSLGALVSSAFTVADGSGSFTLDEVPYGDVRVEATWSAGGIASSVWQDNIPVGSSGIDFVLEINYTLSTLTGSLQGLASPAYLSGAGAARVAEAGGTNSFAENKIELFARGRRALAVGVDPAGRWTIANLLPGKYGVRAYNGVSYTDIVEVELGEGELKEVGFVYNPLPENAVFAFPNPARDSVTFRFESPLSPLEAQVLVFDVAGQLVREIPGLELSAPAPGRYHARWDLANSRGEPVASGVYLFMVKVRGGSEQQTAKVVKKLAVVR